MREYLEIFLQFVNVLTGWQLAMPRRGRYLRRWRLPVIQTPSVLIRLSPALRCWLGGALIDVLVIGGGALCFLIMWILLFT